MNNTVTSKFKNSIIHFKLTNNQPENKKGTTLFQNQPKAPY